MPWTRTVRLVLCVVVAGCGPTLARPDAGTSDVASPGDVTAAHDAPRDEAIDAVPDASVDDGTGGGNDAGKPSACTTRVYYGASWIHDASHAALYDDVDGPVTWDGSCTDDTVGNSSATLSNGWRPFFRGRGACVIGLQASAGCDGAASACQTRVAYGAGWLRPAGHAASYDDVAGVVTASGSCDASGGNASTTLSNGWAPTFSGSNCEVSLRYTQCGALFANSVVDTQCPDPGVLRDGLQYLMVCTSGSAAEAFPMRTSPDLVHWTARGPLFPAGHRPAWASGDFWAPEVHRVGTHYVVYYSARAASDGKLSIGAASSDTAMGPYTDLGHPLIHDASMGLIDVSEFESSDGHRYLLWKEDGNAVGQHTPIHLQPLAADGLSLTGTRSTLITNDRAWEGGVVEGPWMIEHGGMFYLFYSGNGYATTQYALGVARAAAPTGPFTKASGPLVASNDVWSGPGHGSVVTAPGGEDAFVYHAWIPGHVGGDGIRVVLLDRLAWDASGWPTMPAAPSARSQPLP